VIPAARPFGALEFATATAAIGWAEPAAVA
jgi:hypothetical protein